MVEELRTRMIVRFSKNIFTKVWVNNSFHHSDTFEQIIKTSAHNSLDKVQDSAVFRYNRKDMFVIPGEFL